MFGKAAGKIGAYLVFSWWQSNQLIDSVIIRESFEALPLSCGDDFNGTNRRCELITILVAFVSISNHPTGDSCFGIRSRQASKIIEILIVFREESGARANTRSQLSIYAITMSVNKITFTLLKWITAIGATTGAQIRLNFNLQPIYTLERLFYREPYSLSSISLFFRSHLSLKRCDSDTYHHANEDSGCLSVSLTGRTYMGARTSIDLANEPWYQDQRKD